ncbi:hypothetical protein KUTeg_024732 [Tegillarca granosa]|uniref:Uncharacterized protein n=1 Tax=Tegillarca granosa TaxID=220873 RepID=A0ABQ9E190_TEGGR|nr:hypothetical protein KUTeg_024732 [Tegillarca granosa]
MKQVENFEEVYTCFTSTGAFLIPYFTCVIVGGIPLFLLEVSVGQFMGVSGLGAWNICPIFQGIGISTTIIVFFLNCYYNVILCWAFYYMFSSFTLELPWATCGNWWNTCACDEFKGQRINRTDLNDTANATFCNITKVEKDGNITQLRLDPVTEFWDNKVLAISDGIEDMGTIKWDLALTLLFAWVVVYLCICKGIKSSGRVMYVTATSPYLFMLALLIRNSLLPGAGDGVLFYLKPDLAKLSDMEVWVDAGTQIFFSYSISLGALTALGSYNEFNHNCYRDSIIFACANSGTSFFAGFIIFTILGHMSYLQNIPISEVAAAGKYK